MTDQYILDGKRAVKCTDLRVFGQWFETADRRVALETIGEAQVSTVFLGFDHSYGEGPPLLFETMVFGGPLDGEQDRCSTWDEAEAMHTVMVERVREQGIV